MYTYAPCRYISVVDQEVELFALLSLAAVTHVASIFKSGVVWDPAYLGLTVTLFAVPILTFAAGTVVASRRAKHLHQGLVAPGGKEEGRVWCMRRKRKTVVVQVEEEDDRHHHQPQHHHHHQEQQQQQQQQKEQQRRSPSEVAEQSDESLSGPSPRETQGSPQQHDTGVEAVMDGVLKEAPAADGGGADDAYITIAEEEEVLAATPAVGTGDNQEKKTAHEATRAKLEQRAEERRLKRLAMTGGEG